MDTAELLKVNHFDPKTKKYAKETPYILKCDKERGWIFEKNGVEYTMSGQHVDPTAILKDKKAQLEKVKAEFEQLQKEIEGKSNDTTKSASSNGTVDSKRPNTRDFSGVR